MFATVKVKIKVTKASPENMIQFGNADHDFNNLNRYTQTLRREALPECISH